MSCNSHDLLALAKKIQGLNLDDEAANRCVTSRAYYAALHEVAATFEERASEFRVDGESSHREIISRAAVYGTKTLPGRGSAAAIAKIVTRLRRERNKADYNIGESYPPQSSDDVLVRSEQVLTLCHEVRNKRMEKVA